MYLQKHEVGAKQTSLKTHSFPSYVKAYAHVLFPISQMRIVITSKNAGSVRFVCLLAFFVYVLSVESFN